MPDPQTPGASGVAGVAGGVPPSSRGVVRRGRWAGVQRGAPAAHNAVVHRGHRHAQALRGAVWAGGLCVRVPAVLDFSAGIMPSTLHPGPASM